MISVLVGAVAGFASSFGLTWIRQHFQERKEAREWFIQHYVFGCIDPLLEASSMAFDAYSDVLVSCGGFDDAQTALELQHSHLKRYHGGEGMQFPLSEIERLNHLVNHSAVAGRVKKAIYPIYFEWAHAETNRPITQSMADAVAVYHALLEIRKKALEFDVTSISDAYSFGDTLDLKGLENSVDDRASRLSSKFAERSRSDKMIGIEQMSVTLDDVE